MARPAGTARSSDELPDEVLVYLYSSPVFLLRRIDQRAAALFNEAAREWRLTLPQFHILYVAAEVGAFSQVDLARQVATNEASASITITNLIDRGLLTRSRDRTDGRRKLIAATPAGRQLVRSALPAFRQALAETQAPLGADTRQLLDLLASFVAKAGGAVDAPRGLAPQAARKLSVVQHSLHFMVHRAIQLFDAAMSRDLVASGLTLRQYVVLLIVALGPQIGESRIASTIGLDLSNTSFIARGLRAKKLVTVDESTRRRRYRATELGRQLIARLEPRLIASNSQALDLLHASDREPFLRMLGVLVAGGGAAGPPAFARISQGPHWPTAERPPQFDRISRSEQAAAEESLANLLARAAELAGQSPRQLSRLSSGDAQQLEQLLLQLLDNPKRAQAAS